jgi:hypothetical protein
MRSAGSRLQVLLSAICNEALLVSHLLTRVQHAFHDDSSSSDYL